MIKEKETRLLRRKVLGRKEISNLKKEANIFLVDVKTNAVTRAEIQDGSKVFIFHGEALVANKKDIFFPTLKNPIIEMLPSIIVDMGTIPYVCNGADIMAPGIVKVNGNFKEGEVVVIKDVKHNKSLAIGQTLFTSQEIQEKEKGKVIANLHYVGDRIWEAIV